MERPSVGLRDASAADASLLSLVGTATFVETYPHLIPGTDMAAHCARHHATGAYAALLAEPGNRAWLAVAETTGAPVGYCLVTPATLPPGAADPADLEVSRIYVLSRFQTLGLGHRLMALAVAEAVRRRSPRLVLGTHTANATAIAFYRRQGFSVIGERRFAVGASCFCDLVLGRPSMG